MLTPAHQEEAKDVPDMQGQTVVVTGGNSGIGLETAQALAGMGARVIVTARNADKGRAAVARIGERLDGQPQVQLVVFDLADLSSVRRGAEEILAQTPRLDVLINNAGVVLSERRVTVDGYEATFATNHLGPFLLTNLLLPRLRESAPARIVNVASTAHTAARKGIPFDDLQSTHRYSGMRVYGESKLANILFTLELSRRLAGSGVTANSLHPGTVRTGYGADGDARGFLAFGLKISQPFFLSAEKGARTSIYLASSPEVEGVTGEYFVKCKPTKPRRWAHDAPAAQRLWQVSEELVGLAAPAQG
ncbi:MAG TPA: SDR family oxidoreductase [Acidimicrobiales bacterium]|jgi:NAD(P)-dependent dehydrogenase (short-subunit alcohol dehydrogenase family)|nr:SDR family oxidoreductase [Acidimicrobiales bacterium]